MSRMPLLTIALQHFPPSTHEGFQHRAGGLSYNVVTEQCVWKNSLIPTSAALTHLIYSILNRYATSDKPPQGEAVTLASGLVVDAVQRPMGIHTSSATFLFVNGTLGVAEIAAADPELCVVDEWEGLWPWCEQCADTVRCWRNILNTQTVRIQMLEHSFVRQ